MMKEKERIAINICQDFADKHEIIFQKFGEVGFGRECVGFLKYDNYISYNPYSYPDYKSIKEFYIKEFPTVQNSYHKHDCFAVLGRGIDAIIELALWVTKIEKLGKVYIAEFETGAEGFQAEISGYTGYCIAIKKEV